MGPCRAPGRCLRASILVRSPRRLHPARDVGDLSTGCTRHQARPGSGSGHGGPNQRHRRGHYAVGVTDALDHFLNPPLPGRSANHTPSYGSRLPAPKSARRNNGSHPVPGLHAQCRSRADKARLRGSLVPRVWGGDSRPPFDHPARRFVLELRRPSGRLRQRRQGRRLPFLRQYAGIAFFVSFWGYSSYRN